MKYNEDIHPMKKEIGLLLEKVLQGEHIQAKYTHCFVDKNSDTFTCTTGNVTTKHSWGGQWLKSNLVKDCDFNSFAVNYSEKQLEYINENWGDLLFSLGVKDE